MGVGGRGTGDTGVSSVVRFHGAGPGALGGTGVSVNPTDSFAANMLYGGDNIVYGGKQLVVPGSTGAVNMLVFTQGPGTTVTQDSTTVTVSIS